MPLILSSNRLVQIFHLLLVIAACWVDTAIDPQLPYHKRKSKKPWKRHHCHKQLLLYMHFSPLHTESYKKNNKNMTHKNESQMCDLMCM